MDPIDVNQFQLDACFAGYFKELKGYLGGSKLLRCSREKVEQDTNPFFLIGRWSSYTNTFTFFLVVYFPRSTARIHRTDTCGS